MAGRGGKEKEPQLDHQLRLKVDCRIVFTKRRKISGSDCCEVYRTALGPNKKQLLTLLRKRWMNSEMSLKLRSTSVIKDSANMIEDKEIRRICISLLSWKESSSDSTKGMKRKKIMNDDSAIKVQGIDIVEELTLMCSMMGRRT